jgi:hypothetical protein
VPAGTSELLLHIGDNVAMIDHTSCDTLLHFADTFERQAAGRRVEIVGLEEMRRPSRAETGMRLAALQSMVASSTMALSDEIVYNSPAASQDDDVPVNIPASSELAE